MEHNKVAALFSGQGVLQEVALDSQSFQDQLRDTFREIDRVAFDRFGVSASSDLLKNLSNKTLRMTAPELVQLAVFGYSVAIHAYYEKRGRRCSVLLGHGFGEIIALVAGGAFSVREGAEIVCERAAVLEAFAKGLGSMIALTAPACTAEQLVHIAGPAQASVAAENSDMHTVVAGSYAVLNKIVRMAQALNIECKQLNATYPLHCAPLMGAACDELSKRLDSLIGRAPRIPVFSPILSNYYEKIDSAGTVIAEHLVKRIRFHAAVTRLRAHSVNEFVECGMLNGLMKFIPEDAREPELASMLVA